MHACLGMVLVSYLLSLARLKPPTWSISAADEQFVSLLNVESVNEAFSSTCRVCVGWGWN